MTTHTVGLYGSSDDDEILTCAVPSILGCYLPWNYPSQHFCDKVAIWVTPRDMFIYTERVKYDVASVS